MKEVINQILAAQGSTGKGTGEGTGKGTGEGTGKGKTGNAFNGAAEVTITPEAGEALKSLSEQQKKEE